MKFKRILLTSLIGLLAVGLFAGYFYHVGKMAGEKSRTSVCRKVNIYILDSLESSAIDRNDVRKMLASSFAGKKIDSINLNSIEKGILSHGEIMTSQAYTDVRGELNIAVTQRKAVARFENAEERYYSDATGYIFPVSKALRLPVITGNIPVHRGTAFKGYPSKEETGWITGMTSFVDFLGKDKYWKEHIQQIDIAPNGDIVLYLDSGPEKIVFGNLDNKESKMKKLRAYYETIAPRHAPNVYSSVNLKFKNQIICK